MIPSAWAAAVLTLGTYRIVRLLGWDTFPPIAAARDWLTGAQVMTSGSFNARNGLANEPGAQNVRYRRPTLAEGLSCAFCSSVYVGAAVYVAWRLEPSWTLAACFPLSVSATVGLIARWLDP